MSLGSNVTVIMFVFCAIFVSVVINWVYIALGFFEKFEFNYIIILLNGALSAAIGIPVTLIVIGVVFGYTEFIVEEMFSYPGITNILMKITELFYLALALGTGIYLFYRFYNDSSKTLLTSSLILSSAPAILLVYNAFEIFKYFYEKIKKN